MSEKTYKITRFYKDFEDRKTIKTGLTLEEAKEHCKDDETSSQTCSTLENLEHTRIHGHWFDGYERE